MSNPSQTSKQSPFTKYEVFVIAIISIMQFTVVLDFMVLSPLGAMLLKELDITTSQFGLVVSGYAFSAGASGLLAAGFADKFDRKKLLLFFYTGFVLGTLFCGLAPNYEFLLVARIVTGIFGGVIGSVGFAIITDLFRMEVRGRVMGFVQMSFAVSQVVGIPLGLVLANKFGWHSPFLMIVGFSALVGIVMVMYLKPINEHLKIKSERNAFTHLVKTISLPSYLKAFLATTLLATGGFMLMPFGSAFSVNNLGVTQEQLPYLYGITGVCSMIFGPLIGKYSDKIGAYKMFAAGTVLTMGTVAIYTQLGITPFWVILLINALMFAGVTSRIITSSTMVSGIPAPQDRGAFMSINSSVQQISGGIAAGIAGMIVTQSGSGVLGNYDILGYVVNAAMLATVFMMYTINQQLVAKKKVANQPQVV